MQTLDGIEWQAEIWLGAATLSSLCAVAVATITSPADIHAPGDQP